ncbi:sugar O-acetyltransferase [Caulobacter segnis]
MKTQKQRMLAGELYVVDAELQADQRVAQTWMDRYNASGLDERPLLLSQGLGAVGENVAIRAPFFVDYGYNIRLGNRVFMNFNCVILDVAEVTIGEATAIGPGVQILTADHPRDPVERRTGQESGKPIHIGANVWIGGGAIILPGVTIGDDAVIGAGAVVTRDVAPGVTVVGNPARPVAPKG